MNRIFVTLFLFCAIFLLAPRPTTAITMSWTPVGNPGNTADPATGSLYGAVPYSYNIGTYDVTSSQYVAFLNSNDPTGANLLALYNSNMSIIYTAGHYAVSGDGNLPVHFVSYYGTLRFANWMDNGQIGGDTESGAYTLLGDTPTPSNANTITRTAGAIVFLPSENEWYKAAYYNPATSSYYLYPTSSNSTPNASGPTSTPNSANYANAVGSLTEVGAYSGTTSPYDAFDMGGDVLQWNEALIGLDRGLRGGAFFNIAANLESTNRTDSGPSGGIASVGFRLASVPEPSTAVLAVVACGVALWWRKRRK